LVVSWSLLRVCRLDCVLRFFKWILYVVRLCVVVGGPFVVKLLGPSSSVGGGGMLCRVMRYYASCVCCVFVGCVDCSLCRSWCTRVGGVSVRLPFTMSACISLCCCSSLHGSRVGVLVYTMLTVDGYQFSASCNVICECCDMMPCVRALICSVCAVVWSHCPSAPDYVDQSVSVVL